MQRAVVSRITPNHFVAVIRAFLASSKFQGYALSTQQLWGAQLRYAEHPDRLGGVTIKDIRPALVQAYLDGLADRPGTQMSAYSALRQLERWALVRDLLPRPITLGCEVEGSDGGHVPWTDEQVTFGEQHAPPELARVITVAANTGQRGSDLVRMRWSDIESVQGHDGINVKQQKTGQQVWVPFTRELTATLATWERRPGFLLLRDSGLPWSNRNALTWRWWVKRESPELKPLADLVIHGLRGTACVRLLRAGANSRQISDMIGMSEKMVKRYTRLSEQKQNAVAAIHFLNRNTAKTKHFFGANDPLKNRG